jgi:hypothetical protein
MMSAAVSDKISPKIYFTAQEAEPPFGRSQAEPGNEWNSATSLKKGWKCHRLSDIILSRPLAIQANYGRKSSRSL